MIKFSQALKNFETGIHFELIDATLTLKQLKQLLQCIEKKPKPLEFLNPGNGIHLENILLIFDGCLKEDESQQVMSGAVTSREHVIRIPSEKYADACICNFARNCEISSLLLQNLERDEYQAESATKLEDSLIELFSERNFWESVTLKNIQILCNGIYRYPSFAFHYKLLSALTNQKNLKNLALSLDGTPPASYERRMHFPGNQSNRVLNSKCLLDVTLYKTLFRSFLTQALGIERLNITGEPASSFLVELKGTLILHPNLRYLNFGNLFLSDKDYDVLHDVLNDNYNICAIEILEPIDEELREKHVSLMDTMKLPGLQRFRLQQLTQEKLFKIAVEAIENGYINQLTFLVGPETKRQEIIRNEEMFENLFKTLPGIYNRYRSFFKICVEDCRLVIWNHFQDDPPIRIACFLLKKAIEAENGQMIFNLIEAGANIFEYYKVYENHKSLLALLDESNTALSSEWKKTLTGKLQQDLYLFFPSMQRLLSTEIRAGFYSIKSHLDKYLSTWLNRSRWPDFVKMITGVYFCFPERRKGWENAAGKLAKAVEVGIRQEFCMSALALEELQEAVEDLIEMTRNPKCGWLGRSELNEGLLNLGKKLKEEIKKSKINLLQRCDSETSLNRHRARSALETQLQYELQEKDIELERQARENQVLRKQLALHLSSKSCSASSEEDNF